MSIAAAAGLTMISISIQAALLYLSKSSRVYSRIGKI
jgi:hypothetical protein